MSDSKNGTFITAWKSSTRGKKRILPSVWNFELVLKCDEYHGEAMTLSGSALKAIHSLGYTWKAVAGPDFWQYQGETLANIRSEYENKSGDTDEATFDSRYRIVRDEAGSINIWKIDDQPERLVEPAKPILREIANKIGVELVGSTGNDKNTRQLGAHIIDQLNIIPKSQE